MGFLGGGSVKKKKETKTKKHLPMQGIRDTGLTPGSGRSPGERNGNPRQYSCLENPTDGGAWQATVHRVTESDRTEVT